MLFNHLSSLSWQTGVLTFKNRSLKDVKKMLELQYGVEIQMYQKLQKPHNVLQDEISEEPKEEIKLVLFMNYETASDDLVIQGIMR